MIVDLEKPVKIYNKETGLHLVSVIDCKNKTVFTEDEKLFEWKDILFVHDIEDI